MIKANNAFPVFIVKKLNEAESFYSNYFGFAVAFKNEWYLHLVSESGKPMLGMEPYSALKWMMPRQHMPKQKNIHLISYLSCVRKIGDSIIFA